MYIYIYIYMKNVLIISTCHGEILKGMFETCEQTRDKFNVTFLRNWIHLNKKKLQIKIILK